MSQASGHPLSTCAGYQTDWRLGLYGFIFIIIAFLLLLNFLLAIIVEAYMKVKESIDQQVCAVGLALVWQWHGGCLALWDGGGGQVASPGAVRHAGGRRPFPLVLFQGVLLLAGFQRAGGGDANAFFFGIFFASHFRPA